MKCFTLLVYYARPATARHMSANRGQTGSDGRAVRTTRLTPNRHDDGELINLSSSSRTYAFADESGIRAKNDVPKNRRHTVITIIEAMMCEVPHLC
jgi:hypothetical protein